MRTIKMVTDNDRGFCKKAGSGKEELLSFFKNMRQFMPENDDNSLKTDHNESSEDDSEMVQLSPEQVKNISGQLTKITDKVLERKE